MGLGRTTLISKDDYFVARGVSMIGQPKITLFSKLLIGSN